MLTGNTHFSPHQPPNPMLDKITPVLLTYNEIPNISRSLDKLRWAHEVLVVDSYSSDGTLEILREYDNVRVVQRKFDTHAQQWNFGLEHVRSEWVLSLDADYILSADLVKEMAQLPEPPADGYFIGFEYCVFGQPLRSTILPPRLALFRISSGTYVDDGHTQLLKLNGQAACLNSFIYHDDRKRLERWLWSQNRYVILEQRKLRDSLPEEESLQDRLRRSKVIAPIVVLAYCLVLRRGVLDGWAGLYYAYQRTLAEVLLALRLIEVEKLSREEYLGRWLSEQNLAAAQRATSVLEDSDGNSKIRVRLRRAIVLAPLFSLPYRLLARGGLLSGWRGWASAYRRLLCELLLALHLIEMRKTQITSQAAPSPTQDTVQDGRQYISTGNEGDCTRA
jgi:glycosyltransferase involved in cell wall biosynthesis